MRQLSKIIAIAAAFNIDNQLLFSEVEQMESLIQQENHYTRKGRTITSNKGPQIFESINEAKRESRKIQLEIEGALGRGCLTVVDHINREEAFELYLQRVDIIHKQKAKKIFADILAELVETGTGAQGKGAQGKGAQGKGA